MRFHFPKPLHGWRVFGGEVGVIVLGVLIALLAQQTAENISWRQKVRDTRASLRKEIYTSALNMAERIAIQPCLRTQISNLANQLNQTGTAWTGMPALASADSNSRDGVAGPVLPPVYRAPARLWIDDRWRASASDGTLAHFSAGDVIGYSGVYRAVHDLEQLQTAEAAAANHLSYLASNRSLSSRDRLEMYSALAEVDHANWLMDVISTQQLRHIARMHMGFDARQVAADSREMMEGNHALRGNCGLPVHLQLN